MNIEGHNLPTGALLRKPNKSYKALLDAVVTAEGMWVSTSLDEVAGANPMYKGCAIRQAAMYRGITVETASDETKLYVRLVGTAQ